MNELTQMNATLRDAARTGERFVAVRPSSSTATASAAATAPMPSPTPTAFPAAPATPTSLTTPPHPAPGHRPSSSERAFRPAPADRSQLPAGDRAALLIGTATYDHDAFPELSSAGSGVRHMKQVLERPDAGMMDTCLVVGDATRVQMMRGIEAFLEEREHRDTVVVYVSGYAAVSGRDGQLYLVAKDSDPDELEHTAVPADFLRRQVQECRASSKVVLLDYCASGPAGDQERPVALIEPAGAYVVAASERLQAAPTYAERHATMGTSPFTAGIVEGLGAGRVKSGLGPWVTADDLAAYLADHLGERPEVRRPAPVTSTLAVTGNHVIARSAVRALSLLGGETAVPERALAAAVPKTARWTRGGERHVPGWRELASYYRACLADAPSPAVLPSRDDTSAYVPIGSGAEVLFTGTSSTTRAPAGVDTFDWKERDLWYGYPLVSLASGGRRHSANPLEPATVAPLLVQRVDVTVDARGAAALRPTGPIMPHAGVLRACLDDQEAASVLAAWQPGWRADDRDQMLVAMRQLIKRLGLTELEPLDPADLSADGLETATRTGVHNAAGVLYVESSRAAAIAVAGELGTLADEADRVAGTVAAALAAEPGAHAARPSVTDVPPLVTPEPLNESQAAVVRAAMSDTLTVATTPPGTGARAVVVDAVATAVAAGQKVLYVAPHERSVRDVVGRCAELAPGTLVRTGDAQARAEEKQLLRDLTRAAREPARRRASAQVATELAAARGDVEAWRRRLAERVRVETALRKTCSARGAAAERLEMDLHLLGSAWRDDDEALAAWIEHARALDEARALPGWRRRRAAATFLRATAGDTDPDEMSKTFADPEVFESLLLFARAELRVRADRRELGVATDGQLDDEGRSLRQRCRLLSAELVDAAVTERIAAAPEAMSARRLALEPGGRERRERQRDLLEHLGGWAVTAADAEQFAVEPGMFDLVIVDDAHDLPVASLLPVLFRARRALVLGDPARRIRPVTMSDHRHRRAREHGGLSASWLQERRLTHQADSAYDAAAVRAADVVLLDEHDTCHPGIARIFDDTLYDGRLTVTTDVRALRRARDPETGESTLLLWEDVRGSSECGANGGSWRNQAEIDRVVWAVNELRDELPDGSTVGVITPFRAQAEELRSLFRYEPVQVGSVGDDLDICDAMVVSLVAGEGTPEQTVRSVERRAVWTAALTRARSHVVSVGHHAFWQQRHGLPAMLARRSSVRSFHVHPIPPEPFEDVVPPDGLADLLHERLARSGHTLVERNAVLDGYRCDLLIATPDGGGTAVLLDRGAPQGADPAEHAHRLLRRRRLLDGTQPETTLPVQRVTRVLRVPAWQVRSGEAIPGLLD